MKRFVATMLVFLLLAGFTSVIAAAPGSVGDPIISLSYISNTFVPSVREDSKALVSSTIGTLFDNSHQEIEDAYNSYILQHSSYEGYAFADAFTPLNLPAGTSTELVTGSTFILASGASSLQISKGTVINISTGAEIASGATLTVNQRYFCAENTTAVFSSTSGAVCLVDGYYKSGGTVIVNPNKFTDITISDWYYSAVIFASENNLFNGTSPTAFSPGASMTRAMFVTVLYRLAGKPAVSTSSSFSDVASTAEYYYDPVVWANANNIVTGYAGLFHPDDLITREQIATVMHRYASYAGYGITVDSDSKYFNFPDTSSVSPFAVDALKWSTNRSLINGLDGKLMPKATATRAQVAKIILEFGQNIVGM